MNLPSVDEAAADVMARLQHKAVRAIIASRDETKPAIARAVCAGYLEIHRHLRDYLAAAFRNHDIRAWIDQDTSGTLGRHAVPFRLNDFILNVPAIWEFEFTIIWGTVHDANFCAHHYRWERFLGVRPLDADSPFNGCRIPIMHKPNSRFRIGFERRMELKRQLGSRHRSLVGYARKWTKTRFLQEFTLPATGEQRRYDDGTLHQHDKLIPHLDADDLLDRVGYTPEEFWREVKKPRSIAPHKPQLELL